jgi:hypothetical protein
VPDHMHHAELNLSLRVTASIASGKPLRPSTHAMKMSETPRFFNSVTTCIQNFAPSFSAAHIPKTSFRPCRLTPKAT